jgi:hypothetical protein
MIELIVEKMGRLQPYMDINISLRRESPYCR